MYYFLDAETYELFDLLKHMKNAGKCPKKLCIHDLSIVSILELAYDYVNTENKPVLVIGGYDHRTVVLLPGKAIKQVLPKYAILPEPGTTDWLGARSAL